MRSTPCIWKGYNTCKHCPDQTCKHNLMLTKSAETLRAELNDGCACIPCNQTQEIDCSSEEV